MLLRFLVFASIVVVLGCGPSRQEIEQQGQAMMDSYRQWKVRQEEPLRKREAYDPVAQQAEFQRQRQQREAEIQQEIRQLQEEQRQRAEQLQREEQQEQKARQQLEAAQQQGVFATANPIFEAYIDDACSPRVYRLEDWLDCRHAIERYRIVKGTMFTADSCIEAGNVRLWFLRWRDAQRVREWTAFRDIECQHIGQQRRHD